jgi:uncharacterized membrane protein YhaH (DUF805 family)
VSSSRKAWLAPTSGPVYFLVGALLVAAKYGIDQAIAHAFDRGWSPFDYLLWPSSAASSLRHGDDRPFATTMLLVSLPFVGVGVWMTVRRLRSLGWSIGLVALFFVPVVNFVLFAVLTFATTAETGRHALPPSLRTPTAGGAFWDRRAFVAIGVSALATDLLATIGVLASSLYGVGLFVGLPFFLGLSTTLIAGWTRRRPFWHFMALSLAAQLLAVSAFFVFGGEGVICILMAVPIFVPLGFLGSAVGVAVLAQRRDALSYRAFVLVMVALAPALMAAEGSSSPRPELRAVTTTVVVDAPPDVVWRHVVSFPPLAPAAEWWFRAGIATPLSAWIEGKSGGGESGRGAGVGSIRHCVFTTGEFLEPITIWDEPRLLRFDVVDQPAPMKELSPYAIDPPHLHGFLVSRQGEFRLEPVDPAGSSDSSHARTRLSGTTWYTNRMWPQWYWSLWSDSLIHSIHRRVLEHVATLSETE